METTNKFRTTQEGVIKLQFLTFEENEITPTNPTHWMFNSLLAKSNLS